MEDIISCMENVFGAIVFCLALSLLILFGNIEQESINTMNDQSSSMVYFQD